MFKCSTKSSKVVLATILSLGMALSLIPIYPAKAEERLTKSSAADSSSPSVQALKENFAVSKTITLEQFGNPDTEAALLHRTFPSGKYQATGIYVKPNETITLNLAISDATKLPRVAIINPQGYSGNYAYQGDHKTLQPGTNTFSSSSGGLVFLYTTYILPTSPTVTIQGGENIPYFVLGQHTKTDWTNMLSQYPNAPWVQLQSDHALITVSTASAKRYVTDPVALMQKHDQAITIEENVSGTSDTETAPHQAPKYRHHMVEYFASDYYMYAWYYYTAYHTDAINAILDLNAFSTNGWGPWHEIGHQHQMDSWTWDGMGEVTVNIYSMNVQKAFGLPSRLEQDGIYEKAFAYLNQSTRDYHQINDLFVKLTMLWQLQLAYGDQFYPALHRAYRELPSNQIPTTSAAKVQTFIYMTSKIAGQDLTPFFSKWGLPATQDTKNKINQLQVPLLTAEIWKNRDSNNSIKPK
ncbi:M60 family metallopeptidase [Paenibacillus sp. 1001270B_150601_E10]|uniref:M60 family metallopeptidase n=1 Tax=Paenibacillus sp. 1001270B_150601_E10 TaxID=2787079 RepID=UPI00189CFB1C|nr:M60 family metallopeptidase [Paenibacillus sp. 1001270B_150601_E10]